MHFHIKRYLYGIWQRRLWLLLILLLPLAYLVTSAIHSDRFSINQNINISNDAPVVLVASSNSIKPVGEVVANPDDFLLSNFAVRKLYTNFYAGTAVYRADRQFRNLLETIKDNMSLTMPSEDLLMVSYHGKDRKVGKALVGYYSQRLIQKIEEGFERSNHRDINSKTPFLMGSMEIKAHRAFWRSERFLPFVLTGILSFLGVLMVLAVLEWSDPSFKSERQVAQYLNLPILGSLPDLKKTFTALTEKLDS
jgi:hypothetical protein